ncbi:MAG: 1-(5-phosphoribosyl)-5-[(5-phosphoribosylamino)methylideneamino]imidazole-4-carboxamide isomerase [Candidatus Omnitrophota bacterium]
MIIFPAIDIKDGSVVRLAQGHFNEVTKYGQDPAAMARQWVSQGAEHLHIVDLDGAQQGRIANWPMLKKIAKSVTVPLQVGGGVRTEEDIAKLLEIGYERIILGTRAVNDPEFLESVIKRWPENIAVSVDAKNGIVTRLGWTEMTKIRAVDFIRKLKDIGLKCVIFTDVACDGMLCGPNMNSLNKILDAVHIPLIASGGISSMEDIKNLKALETKGLIGAITGKALYEGTLDLREAIAA